MERVLEKTHDSGSDLPWSFCFKPYVPSTVRGLHFISFQGHSLQAPQLQLPSLAELVFIPSFALSSPKIYHDSSAFVFFPDPFICTGSSMLLKDLFYWYFRRVSIGREDKCICSITLPFFSSWFKCYFYHTLKLACNWQYFKAF